jgi:hypothetical protein
LLKSIARLVLYALLCPELRIEMAKVAVSSASICEWNQKQYLKIDILIWILLISLLKPYKFKLAVVIVELKRGHPAVLKYEGPVELK